MSFSKRGLVVDSESRRGEGAAPGPAGGAVYAPLPFIEAIFLAINNAISIDCS
jgi:hypothetical protein